jgi:hypothetical protein
MMFLINSDKKLAVSKCDTAANVFPPCGVLVTQNLVFDNGVVPVGAYARASLTEAFGEPALSLMFTQVWPALSRWHNELILFPYCVDYDLLDCLQVITST